MQHYISYDVALEERKMNTLIAGLMALLALGVLANSASAQQSMDIYGGVLVEQGQDTPNISTDEFQTILADKSATVGDVRSFREYAIDHIPGAINIAPKPGTTKEEYTSDIAHIGRIVSDNKAAPIVLYCSGPFCGKSKRVAKELVEDGYTNVRRYQLGMPVWRALVGVTEVELEGVQYVFGNDQTAVLIDARDPGEFEAGSLRGARNIPQSQDDAVKAAKKDGRLPMHDHNARIIVFGQNGDQAGPVASALAKNAFHNVSYFSGAFETLQAALN